ncbi:MAG: type IV pilus assembly protein PilM [Syntrophorhabdales bacterium]|jgi:type IV pilus assembly protein PilM
MAAPADVTWRVREMAGRFLGRFGSLQTLSLGRNRQVLGVDIGTTSIKVCLLKKTKEGGLAVSRSAFRSYDQDLLHDGNIIDRALVARELRSLLDAHAISARYASSALSSYSVITKRVTMPFLEKAALESAVRLEVENIIPFPLKDIYYSYCIMGADEERERMINLLIVAAKREIVEGYVKTFEQAGLNLSVLDVDIFAITNLIEGICGPTGYSILAADIGASVTNIAIVKGENIEFTREILIGGKYVTAEIAKQRKLSPREAEEKKLRADDDVAEALQDFVSNISSEINRTINFYVATKPRETVGRIYLTGGSSLVPGIAKQIEGDTGIAVEFLDPFLYPGASGTVEMEEDRKFFMPVAFYLSARRDEGTS